MTLDATFLAVARKLIAKYGKWIVLSRPTAGGFASETLIATNTPQTALVKSIVGAYKAELVDGTKIQSGDLQLIVAADRLEWVPEQGKAQVHLGPTTASPVWNVIKADPVYSGEVAAVYVLQVRR